MPTYGSVTPDFLTQLEAIAPGRVTAGEEVNPDYARDKMPSYGVHPPEAAVEELVKLANDAIETYNLVNY